MTHSIIGVAYGYLLIGDLRTIQEHCGGEVLPEFAHLSGGLLRIRVATHTGDVGLEWTVIDGPLVEPGRRRGASATVLLPLRAHRLLASTFHGLDPTFAVDLPDTWSATQVRVTSPRYGEFDGEFLDEAEPILLEFGRP